MSKNIYKSTQGNVTSILFKAMNEQGNSEIDEDFSEDLIFLGVDMPSEINKVLSKASDKLTDGISESEIKAYNLGIHNAIAILKGFIASNRPVVHVDNLRCPTELFYDEVVRIFKEKEGE